MTKFYTILLAALSYSSNLHSQTIVKKNIKGTYVALWGDTFWLYKFSLDNTYQYETSGHFGNSITKGQYRINQDTIILTAFSKDIQKDSSFYFRTDTVIIDNDDCLISLSMGYEHIKLKHKNDTIHSSYRRNLKLPGRPRILDN